MQKPPNAMETLGCPLTETSFEQVCHWHFSERGEYQLHATYTIAFLGYLSLIAQSIVMEKAWRQELNTGQLEREADCLHLGRPGSNIVYTFY